MDTHTHTHTHTHHEKYGKIQPIFFKLLTTYGGLSEKKNFFPLKKLKLYLFQIYYREGGCIKLKKNFFAFLDELSHFQQVLKKCENQKILTPPPRQVEGEIPAGEVRTRSEYLTVSEVGEQPAEGWEAQQGGDEGLDRAGRESPEGGAGQTQAAHTQAGES